MPGSCLGGLVSEGSLKRKGTLLVCFHHSPTARRPFRLPSLIRASFPILFREGQGVVAEGKLDRAGIFIADTVLAKHDENYMPREVAELLKKRKRSLSTGA